MSNAWNEIHACLPAEASSALWRAYSDALNRRVLERWLGKRRFRRALKTDSFDEAVGEGVVTSLEQYAQKVVLMDCAALALRAARERHGAIALLAADVRRLPFREGSFDLIFSNSTLDHFADASAIGTALAELARALKSGGTLILTLDNPLNPAVALRNLLPERARRALRLTPYPTGKTLTPRALCDAVRRAGLRPVRRTAILHCPRLPAVWLCRWLSKEERGVWLVRALLGFELLSRSPLRYLTGHYVAVEAVKQ